MGPKREIEIKYRNVEGKRTLGSVLMKFHREDVELHKRFFEENRTWGVEKWRKEFQKVLNESIDEETAYALGRLHDEIAERNKVIRGLIERRDKPVEDIMIAIVGHYKEILRLAQERAGVKP